VDGMVGKAEAWIETFGGEVSNLEGIGGVGLGDPVADGLGQRMGQGAGVMMGNNDKRVHSESPSGITQRQASMLG
jgi:hypothetical protein